MPIGRRGRGRAAAPPLASEPPRRSIPQLPSLASLVVAALDQGVVVVDADERVVLVNPAAREMDVVDVDRLAFQALTALVTRARAEGRLTAAVELPIVRLGREPIALAVTAVPLRTEDGADAVGLLLADVSEQRRLEDVRRDFVANISHELKPPVGALALLAEAVQDAAGEPVAVARFGGRMQHESARLTRLVRELMELSRVQGTDPMPAAAEIDVEHLVTEAVDRARLVAEQAGIVLALRCEPGLVVRGDDGQLVTAVANLVDNAIAYSGAGTEVTITGEASSDHQARPTVDITVADHGLGIAEADLDRIFERFYRVDPARSRATGGTGLGLAIVKNVVTNHLGTVSVQSVAGQGSQFRIRLPRVHSAARASVLHLSPAEETQ
ncbi:MAG: sensor histidine kinase [Jatrophihabitantaceae bacterium]